jgi:hypothetical protein
MMKRARHSKNIRTDQGNLPQASPYSADQRASETKHEYEIARRGAYWTKITGIATIAAAIFAAIAAGLAGVTAGIFWKQLGTMQAQLTAQEADFRIDQRPVLAITPLRPEIKPQGFYYDAGTKRLSFTYAMKNYGKGTALDVKVFDYISVLGSHFKPHTRNAYNSDLVTTADFWTTAQYDDTLTPENNDSAVKSDNGKIVKIIIKYKDAYGVTYENDICLWSLISGAIGYCDLTQLAIPTDDDNDEKNYK